VVITEGMVPDGETVRRAHEEAINLLGTARDTFTVVGQLVALGIGGNEPG
jgi:predicted transcriptional regulator